MDVEKVVGHILVVEMVSWSIVEVLSFPAFSYSISGGARKDDPSAWGLLTSPRNCIEASLFVFAIPSDNFSTRSRNLSRLSASSDVAVSLLKNSLLIKS